MHIRAFVWLVLGLTVAALLGACAATGNAPVEAMNSTATEMMLPAKSQESPLYRYYPGDEFSITAVNRPELAVPLVRIDPYGYITYPYLGQVHVKGLTSEEIAERLAQGLQERDYYRRVALRVSFVGAREQYVYVMGEVQRPGPIPIAGSIPLMEAIGKAGGKTYDAEMSTVLWIRGSYSPPGVVKLDLKALGDPRTSKSIPNFVLIPGDVIFIPDSVIASVQRFFNRMFDIIRPVLALETGIVLYNDTERTLSGRYPAQNNSNQTIIIAPSLDRD